MQFNTQEEYLQNEGDDAVCRICLQNQSKYTCPRCNIRYCSTECYKNISHAQCSEAFYKSCFMEGLKECDARPDDKNQMMEMLQRLDKEHPVLDSDDEEEEESDDFPSLAERIADLDLDRDTDQIWERLTPKEKEEFETMLKDGRLSQLVDVWDPWWNIKENILIKECADPTADKPEDSSLLQNPTILENIPDIALLLPKGTPSEYVKYTALSVLYSYVYCAKRHNGDLKTDPVQCSQDMLDLCPSLSSSQQYHSTEEAIHGCLQCLQENAKHLFASRDHSISILEDVQKIIVGPSKHRPLLYSLAALSDVYRILVTAEKTLEKDATVKIQSVKEQAGRKERKKIKHKIHLSYKKVKFLLSWCRSYGIKLHHLVPEMALEQASLLADRNDYKRKQKNLEERWGSDKPPKQKTLIEEV